MSADESPLPGLEAFEPPEKSAATKPGKKKILWESFGAVKVPIYRLKDRYCIVYREAKKGPRLRVTKVSLKEAKAEAEKICRQIARGQISAGRLTADELLQAAAALDILRPRGLTMDGLARDAAAAVDAAGGTPLAELARFWVRHHQAGTSRRTPSEILTVMLKVKTGQGLDAHGLGNLRSNVKGLCAKFTGPIGEITAAEIRGHIEKLEVGQRTRNNVRRDLVTLFEFARAEGDLVEDRKTEAAKVGRWKESKKAPAVYTPHELAEWLGVVRDEWEPFVVLGAFAGVRSFEIERMDWSDILWTQQEIYLRPEITKTGEGRYIPLQPNLAEWLLPHRRSAGLIRPSKGRFNKEFARMATALERPWSQNALRHSYGSYRLAMLQDLGRLTVEMGNSVSVNRKNYQNPRSRQSAVEWFSLVPVGRITPKPKLAAGT